MESDKLEEDIFAAYEALSDPAEDSILEPQHTGDDNPDSNYVSITTTGDEDPHPGTKALQTKDSGFEPNNAADLHSPSGSTVDVRPGTAAPRGSLGDAGDFSGIPLSLAGSRRASATSVLPPGADDDVVYSGGDTTHSGDDVGDVMARAGSRLASTSSMGGDPPVREVSRPGTAAAVPTPRPPSIRPPASRPGSETPAQRAARASAARTRTPPTVSEVSPSAQKQRRPENLDEPLVEVAEEELEFQGENIWEVAERMSQAQILRGRNITDNQGTESTLLFVGGRQSGKSSMIHKLLDREETPKTTLGLEYSYGRKAGKGVAKDVCHIWELGGGTTYMPLLDTPLRAARLPRLTVFVVIDLTRPETMWNTLDTMLKTLREGIEAEIGSSQGREMQLKERLRAATELRVPSDHQDAAHLRPFPVPLVLVGGRYDAFQDWEPEKKKLVCRTIRYLAHVNGATLQFFSASDSALVKKAKDLMASFAFGGETSGRHLAQDYNKPLMIPAGADSLPVILGVGADPTFNAIRNAFVAQYPQDEHGVGALPDDPAKDLAFREPEIDQLRAQKDQELDRMRREIERRRKWGEEL